MIYLVHDLVELRNDKDLRSQPRKTVAVIVLACLVLLGGIAFSLITAPKNNSAALQKEYQEALDEASSLPEGNGKIVLTQRLLKATYARVCGAEAKFGVFDRILSNPPLPDFIFFASPIAALRRPTSFLAFSHQIPLGQSHIVLSFSE